MNLIMTTNIVSTFEWFNLGFLGQLIMQRFQRLSLRPLPGSVPTERGPLPGRARRARVGFLWTDQGKGIAPQLPPANSVDAPQGSATDGGYLLSFARSIPRFHLEDKAAQVEQKGTKVT